MERSSNKQPFGSHTPYRIRDLYAETYTHLGYDIRSAKRRQRRRIPPERPERAAARGIGGLEAARVLENEYPAEEERGNAQRQQDAVAL